MIPDKEKIVRVLARLSASAPQAQGIALSPGEWLSVAGCAELHGLAPMVYANILRAELFGEIPPEAVSRLRRQAAACTAMNILMLGERDRIAEAAARQGIPLLALKGAALTGSFYEPFERPMSDLDYLIMPDCKEEARKLFSGLGYRRVSKGRLREEFEERFSGEDYFELQVAGTTILAEVHREVMPTEALKAAFSALPELFFRRVEENLPRMCPENVLLFGALHLGPVHGFSRMLWVSDADRIVRGSELDADFLLAQAGECGAGRALYAMLLVAGELYGTPVPPAMMEALRSKGYSRGISSGRVVSWLARTAPPAGVAMIPYTLSLRRARYIARQIFPSAEFLRLRYGISGWKVPFYYLARPAALAGKALAAVSRGEAGGEPEKRKSPPGQTG